MADEKNKNLNKQGFDREDVEKHKVIAGIGYLNPILLIIGVKKSKFLKFHLNQALLMLILGTIITFLCYNFGRGAIMDNPYDFFSILTTWFIIYSLLILGIFILISINMFHAFKGEAKRIPIIGKITIIPHSNDVNVEDSFEIEGLIGQSVKCTNCGNKIASGKKFCSSCGTPAPELVTEKVKCTHCGSDNLKGFKFCSECGEKPATEKE